MAETTALVHTKNSAKTLQGCLDSLKFVDQVFVVDMGSIDSTRTIARQYSNVTILEHEDVGYVEPARNYALKHVKTAWTLIVDSDEEVQPALKQKIVEITNAVMAADVYLIPRKNIIFDDWIEHTGWWPDYQLRFFKTGAIQWSAKIHAQPKVTGKHEFIPPDPELALLHHNYQTIEQFIDRLNRYTTIEVKHSQDPKANAEKSLPEIFSSEFSHRFFVRDGVQDGQHGFALSYLQAMYQVAAQLKRWQAAGFSDNKDEKSLLKSFDTSLQELRYWLADYHVKHSSGSKKLYWKLRRKMKI